MMSGVAARDAVDWPGVTGERLHQHVLLGVARRVGAALPDPDRLVIRGRKDPDPVRCDRAASQHAHTTHTTRRDRGREAGSVAMPGWCDEST